MKIFTLLMLLSLISMPAFSSDYSDKSKQSGYIVEAKDFLKSRMKDPGSVKWQNVRFNTANVDGKALPAVCGEVNSKNAFGGYTGFQRFVSVPPAIAVVEDEVADFHNIWNVMCR